MTFEFKWSGDPFRKKRFDKAQKAVDEAVMERMIEFVPVGLPKYKKSGKLRDSVENPSPGVIVYKAPFARITYYDASVNHANGGNVHGTRLWFETTKQHYLFEIKSKAVRLL